MRRAYSIEPKLTIDGIHTVGISAPMLSQPSVFGHFHAVLTTPSRQEAINMEGGEGGGTEAMHSSHTVATFSLKPRLLPCRKTGKNPLPVFLQGRSLGTRLATSAWKCV